MVNVGAYVAATAAAAAGITGDALVIAVAIAGAESSWRLDARGDKDLPASGCGSYGLWQINSCPDRDADSPTRFGRNPQALFDPLINARSMAAISSGGMNWQPWTVYKTGDYRKHVGTARDAIEKIDPKKVAEWAAVPAGEGAPKREDKGTFGFAIGTPFGDLTSESGVTGVLTDAVNAAVDPLAAVARFFALLLKPETWLRALGLIVGLALLVLGVMFITKDQAIGVLP